MIAKRQLFRDYRDQPPNSWQRQRSFDAQRGLDSLERRAERVVAVAADDGEPAVAVGDDGPERVAADAERVAAFVADLTFVAAFVAVDGDDAAVAVDGQLRQRRLHVDAAG